MESIIFIGPIGAGKSTVSKMVAEKLSMPWFSLDGEEHLAESLGYDVEHYRQLWEDKGLSEAYAYRRGFYDRLVSLFLKAHEGSVLDLGGGHPIAPDPEKQETINKTLEPYPHIFLLMPTPDVEESLKILRERNQIAEGEDDLNKLYFQNGNRTFWDIAKFPIYTEGKTPEQTCLEVLEKLQ